MGMISSLWSMKKLLKSSQGGSAKLELLLIFQEDANLSGNHAREGLTCVVAVKIPNPEF